MRASTTGARNFWLSRNFLVAVGLNGSKSALFTSGGKLGGKILATSQIVFFKKVPTPKIKS